MRSLLALLPLLAFAGDDTALDRYVRQPDPAYRYQLVNAVRTPGFTTYFLDLTSQRWLTEAEVDRPEWRHSLIIIRPDAVEHQTGLLLIDGGSNDGKPPTAPDLFLSLLAMETKTVVAQVKMVPNQPLKFAGEEKSRSEDSFVAYTWRRFLETGDDRWPARLPMTKAAVRAMDAVTDFCATAQGGGVKVGRFVVAGGSKRGWTTWTTAAVDRRVVAIIPLVIDALNIEPSFIHHWRSYGFWSPAIQDYVDNGVMNWLGTPEWRQLLDIEDPYQYRDRVAIPKMLVNSSGDQFFLPDSSRFYFDSLPGEKYLRYVPNTGHGLNTVDVPPDLLAFYQALLTCTPRPRFSWTVDRAAGTIRVRTMDEPSGVLLWQAANPEARDFRYDTIGPAWTSSPVSGENGIYSATLPTPAKGFAAFFLELTFPSGGVAPFRFTTEVVVTPDTYPFDPPAPQK
ncbi:MAG: PhoPQ-activated pathogenicity-related family protein [Candidatus Solibacter usitatus]|nr:PhoPQ-activated pathogenicity-related family protein [Candidatus Solibacter usitatus]